MNTDQAPSDADDTFASWNISDFEGTMVDLQKTAPGATWSKNDGLPSTVREIPGLGDVPDVDEVPPRDLQEVYQVLTSPTFFCTTFEKSPFRS